MRFFKERVARSGHIARTRFVLTVVFVTCLLCSLLHSASVSAQAGTTGNDGSRASTNQAETSTLWSDAAKRPHIGAEELGLSNPKFLFVPGRYTQSGLGAIFFNGKKIVLPNVKSDMVGVLPSGSGLIVANFERNGQTTRIVASKSPAISAIMSPEDIAKLSPEQKLRLIKA